MLQKLISIPFFVLLLTIGVGPLLFEKLWNKYYPLFIAFLSTLVASYYIFYQHDFTSVLLSVFEFVQFIALIFALYTVTSGIFIDTNIQSTPRNNILFLVFGAIISNFIGTTGASMLLIRPFIKINQKTLRPYHIVFFIFIISNVGGALTPIGDPPLFIGFLKGIPFFWTVINNFLPWLIAMTLLCSAFYYYDSKNNKQISVEVDRQSSDEMVLEKNDKKNLIAIHGKKNIFFIIMIILSVFVNPIIFPNLPIIHFHGHEISFIREILFFSIAIVAFLMMDKKILEKNHFTWEPIRELAILFLGIFITMTPVLALLTKKIQNIDADLISSTSLFWGTGILSSFLDNAPTYLNFLTISMSCLKLDVSNIHDVIAYSGGQFLNSISDLRAISIGAVFFGAMTYIGNGPNLMVKAIAEKKIKMPTFFEYIINYSIKILLPILFVCWLICCR